jgi:hypothetical protein
MSFIVAILSAVIAILVIGTTFTIIEKRQNKTKTI